MTRLRLLAAAAAASIALVAPPLAGQQPADTTPRAPAPESPAPGVGLRVKATVDPFALPTDPTLSPFGRLTPIRRPATTVADEEMATLRRSLDTRTESVWGATLLSGLAARADTTQVPGLVQVGDIAPPPRPDRAALPPARPEPVRDSTDLFGDYADLGLQLNSRLEAKGERNKNERCIGNEIFNPVSNCAGSFQPTFDFQFNVQTGGVVADRVHVNVDYDSEREFEASNNIQIYYEGKPDEMIERLEVGNVSFQPPPSRYITSGIPSGNYGIQAIGQLGPMRFRTIVAQQKGNLVKDQVYTVGERTLQSIENEVDDYRIEPRRFFFTVDPRRWWPGVHPDIDILDRAQMQRLAAQLPDSVRPSRLSLYRYRFGSQPQNPNGPQFLVNDRPDLQRGPIYELLREGVDYYVDPSQLWVALVSPASLNGERYVVAYAAADGRAYRITGDPVTQNEDRPLYANLLYDPSVEPGDDAFFREIRSVYRVGGEDVQRATVQARIVSVNGQERPVAGTAQTFLQMLGLAQSTNPAALDAENRLWPRSTDPNYNTTAGGSSSRIIRDNFLIFPSLEPFSAAGLVQPGNPANDTIYRTPGEYLYSSQHPQPLYRLRLRYSAEGGGDLGTLSLGAVQIRSNSERISVNGRELARGTDYTVDYELGRVTFSRPDTLFPQPRQVTVRYEENPLFTSAPTNIFGLAGEFPFESGRLWVTAISQSQKTTFNRPPLGFEPASSLVAGISGAFNWDVPLLSRGLARLPFAESSSPSRISISGEVATSRPQPNAAGQAYVETFEGEGGVAVALGENAWYLSSQPAAGRAIPARFGADALDLDRAATAAWQNFGVDLNQRTFFAPSIEDIDPRVRLQGASLSLRETVLWLTLYPPKVGGRYDIDQRGFDWRFPDRTGKRWRSLRTTLSPSGTDLSRVETIEFWAFVDTSTARRPLNPTFAIDIGEISENTVSFQPETLVVRGSAAAPDSVFTGRRLTGFDTLDTERDPFTRTFNYTVDDVGLPGDLARDVVVIDSVRGLSPVREDSIGLCRARPGTIELMGDTRATCTIGNSRLDEEDLDLDGQLNIPSAVRDNERAYRWIIDLRDRATYARTGVCYSPGAGEPPTRCWVYVRVPFRDATDTIGSPQIRRMRALRLTMLSGSAPDDTTFQQTALARFRLVGSPWVKRQDRPLRGIAGESVASGYVIAGIIGTTDQDSTAGLFYESPPGVTDESETRSTGFGETPIQINERSLRLQAGNVDSLQRAEAYYRFPDAQKSFMGYRELRVWARGRGNGWGRDGELQFFIKIGRDADNFYLYRTPVGSGNTRAAWEPEIRVQFERFFALRARIQNAFLQGGASGFRRVDCAGADSLLLAASPSALADSNAYAACDGTGYMVFTKNPNVSPPNLAAVQEMAVGLVRLRTGGGASPLQPADTLELWVDDIRLTGVENTPGYAGQVGIALVAGDLGDIRVNVSRRDPYFRQLGEQPSFLTDNALDVGSALRLDKLLPARLGFALPVSVSYAANGSEPLFVSRTDVEGRGIQGLRTPENRSTAFSIGVRRSVPLRDRWFGPVVNNLVLNVSQASARARGEYSDSRGSSSAYTLDYAVVAGARTVGVPRWMDRALQALPAPLRRTNAVQSFRQARFRWNPAQFRFASGVARNASTTLSFQKPAESALDSSTTTRGLQHAWRNATNLELRPLQSLSARWDLTSLRDLRDYPDTSAIGVAAGAERTRILGLDGGLERERSMSTALSFSPQLTIWLRPRAEFTLAYNFVRDPNAREPLRDRDSTGAFRLPKRFDNAQTVTLGGNVDLGRLVATYGGNTAIVRRLALALQPADVSWNRQLRSAFDNIAAAPPLRYQLAFGGIGDFLSVNDRLATASGISSTVSASNALGLPFGMRLANRYQRSAQRSFTRRLNNTLGVHDQTTLNWPDVALQWAYRPPAWLQPVVTTVGGQLAYRGNRAETFSPADNGVPAQRGSRETTALPLTGSVVWAFAGGLSTTGSFSESETVELRGDGSRTTSDTREMGAEMGRAFKAPATWNLKDDIRARIGITRFDQGTVVVARADTGERRSRTADNGRYTINLNLDTDMNENLLFSLTGSRTVTYDRVLNRRFNQLVLTAVMTLQFFAGELR